MPPFCANKARDLGKAWQGRDHLRSLRSCWFPQLLDSPAVSKQDVTRGLYLRLQTVALPQALIRGRLSGYPTGCVLFGRWLGLIQEEPFLGAIVDESLSLILSIKADVKATARTRME